MEVNYVLSSVLVVLIIYWFKCFVEKIIRSPPGPWGLPFFGYYPFLGSDVLAKISKLADKYGDVMAVNFFGDYYYFLNTVDVVKEVLIKQTNFTSDRPLMFESTNSFALIYGSRSFISLSGENWRSVHTFMLSKMTDLGMGKTQMEDVIVPLCDKLVDYVNKTNGEESDFYEYLTNFTSNVITSVVFSKDYAFDDPQYIRLRDDARDFFLTSPGMKGSLSGFGFHLWDLLTNDRIKKIRIIRKKADEYFLPIIEKRIVERQNGSKELNDLMDYLVEMHLQGEKYFEKEAIIGNCLLWFIAGTETTSSILYNAINLLILNPEIQDRVQEEIDTVCGSSRNVSYQERHLLPYTQAVIQEVLRFVALVPFAVERSNSKSITVTTKSGTYVTPEKSHIVPNISTLSKDPKCFKNPENFDPNNFLNEKGEFEKNDANLQFSAGKRICIGSTLATMELFIAFVTLFQRFRWSAPNGKQVTRELIDGVVMVLKNYNCCALPRN